MTSRPRPAMPAWVKQVNLTPAKAGQEKNKNIFLTIIPFSAVLCSPFKEEILSGSEKMNERMTKKRNFTTPELHPGKMFQAKLNQPCKRYLLHQSVSTFFIIIVLLHFQLFYFLSLLFLQLNSFCQPYFYVQLDFSGLKKELLCMYSYHITYAFYIFIPYNLLQNVHAFSKDKMKLGNKVKIGLNFKKWVYKGKKRKVWKGGLQVVTMHLNWRKWAQ